MHLHTCSKRHGTASRPSAPPPPSKIHTHAHQLKQRLHICASPLTSSSPPRAARGTSHAPPQTAWVSPSDSPARMARQGLALTQWTRQTKRRSVRRLCRHTRRTNPARTGTRPALVPGCSTLRKASGSGFPIRRQSASSDAALFPLCALHIRESMRESIHKSMRGCI
eukprot:354448-Chlamydomonas_euryale.AAC.10